MPRIRAVGVFGTISNNPLSSGGTTLTSDGLEELPEIAAPDYAVIILDPKATAGVPEIVYVTAHTASSNTATISRGEEQTESHGSAAREHAQGVLWVHGATAVDFNSGAPIMKSQVFTTSGNFDATQVPFSTDLKQYVKVRMVGGGGGGVSRDTEGRGPGGAGGGYAEKIVDVTGETSITVTPGAGGSGGSTGGNNDGTDGSTSSFGAFVSATGGERGRLGISSSTPGNGSGGDVNVPGGEGDDGLFEAEVTVGEVETIWLIGGVGGDSQMGRGGRRANVSLSGGVDGAPGGLYGGGGGGAVHLDGSDNEGGDGADGIVIVEWLD